MPAVYDLLGLWSTVGCPTLIVFGTISADDFYARMLPYPCGEGLRTAVFQHIDWLVRLSIFLRVFVKRQFSLLNLASEVGYHSSVLNSHGILRWDGQTPCFFD